MHIKWDYGRGQNLDSRAGGLAKSKRTLSPHLAIIIFLYSTIVNRWQQCHRIMIIKKHGQSLIARRSLGWITLKERRILMKAKVGPVVQSWLA